MTMSDPAVPVPAGRSDRGSSTSLLECQIHFQVLLSVLCDLIPLWVFVERVMGSKGTIPSTSLVPRTGWRRLLTPHSNLREISEDISPARAPW